MSRYRTYYQRHKKERLTASRVYYSRLRNLIFEILGDKCTNCGFEDIRALQIDHINGGGSQERKTTKRHPYLVVLEKLEKGDEGYQILCANCNWIKRHEKEELVRT